MELDELHRRARERRAHPLVYGFVRVTFQIFFHVYFRFERIGLQHVPRRGPVIIAANHRSFLDPFVIACMARRPMYYVAKKEIFQFHPVVSWLLAALGAFPIDRGAGDADSIATAKAILERGDIVLIFPEGTRTRPGPLGRAKRGVGRLALETGVPVVPLAVIGTEAIRRGWRIRPHKVRLRAGRPLHFPRVEEPSPALAGAVTDRIWPCVMLQWEWLGGQPPLRRAAVIAADDRGASLAAWLARGGVQVELTGARSRDTAVAGGVRTVAEAELSVAEADVVCLAVPGRDLPAALAAVRDRLGPRTGLVLVCDGVVPPRGADPLAFAAERCGGRPVAAVGMAAGTGRGAGGMAAGTGRGAGGGSLIVAARDRGFARLVAEPLRAAGLQVRISTDLSGGAPQWPAPAPSAARSPGPAAVVRPGPVTHSTG